jgi:predicted membrane protein (TIGR00267 family)
MRVGCVAFVTALFTMFVAEYAELRARLQRSTEQLSLSPKGHLAATQLGRRVTRMAATAAAVTSVSSFVGAAIPLLIAGSFPTYAWIGLAVALILLAVLGSALATSVRGARTRWVIGLVLLGVVVAVIGSQLNIA